MLLTAMIVDPIVCGRIASKWNNNLFRSKWANLVGTWCVQYHNKYGKAPSKHIESQFRTWSGKTRDKDTIALVEKFLTGLSDEYISLKRESNSQYILDKAADYFSQVRIERLKDDLENDLTTNDVEKALERISTFDQVKVGTGEAIDVFHDKEWWKKVFAEKEKGLIRFPGKMGQFFGEQFARGHFISFMAQEGKGKSFALMDIAFRAILQRRKVAYFEAGDMTEEQWGARLATRITSTPMHPCLLKYPLAIRKLKSGKYVVDSKEKKFKHALDWRDVLKGCRKINKKRIHSKDTYFRFSSHYANTLHVKTIEAQLREWEKEGWVADVVVLDYADLLDISYPKLEKRDQIDKSWMHLRKISQMFHCLVVTATQGNRMSYDSNVISRKHVSEDKRKLAHVTGMIGLNQTEEEKKHEIMRFNWIKIRDGKYSESRCLAVAGCLALGNIAIRSVL